MIHLSVGRRGGYRVRAGCLLPLAAIRPSDVRSSVSGSAGSRALPRPLHYWVPGDPSAM
jgi:hypothetical protein